MKYFLYAFVLCCNAANAADTPVLKVAWGRHDIAPVAITHDGQLIGGVIFDIGNAIASELKIKAEFIEVPRRRQASTLLTGKVDLVFPTSPKWQKNPEQFAWTTSLFKRKDVYVVSNSDNKHYTHISDLYGLSVGAIRGYVYPSLTKFFETNQISRRDVSDITANFDKLKYGRIDGLIASEWIAYYELQQANYRGYLKLSNLDIGLNDVYAAISPKSSFNIERIKQAVETLKAEQVINNVLNKYRPKNDKESSRE